MEKLNMHKIIETEKIPIKLWLKKIEPGALQQAKNLANLPFAFHHVAIMPDSHQGYGMPIGGVLATKNVVIPNAVGVDIGCGMCAVRTSLQKINRATLKEIRNAVINSIPVGFSHNKAKQRDWLDDSQKKELSGSVIEHEYESSLFQIGTLGGGNHFIEIQEGSDGYIWIMLHSGSRNLGLKVATYYNRAAKDMNKKMGSDVPKHFDLAYLPLDTDDGLSYMREMTSCVDFALQNRKLMLKKIMDIFADLTSEGFSEKPEIINIAHNYAAVENHFGEDVVVHRKGATKAFKDLKGIIPGSQGSKSYIVRGLGNPESFKSCSHGAGRVMGRKEAQKKLDLASELKKMNDQNIIHGLRSVRDLDEAAGAYKDIDVVMENQKDLVEILVELKPLAVVKG